MVNPVSLSERGAGVMKTIIKVIPLILVILLALVYGIPGLAGGWATITLDNWPAQITVGEPITIGFTVRQHGNDDSKMNGLDPTVTARHRASGETFIVHVKPSGSDGHYSVILDFPVAGAWSWSIQAFTMDQPMPDLIVASPAASLKAPTNPVDVPAAPRTPWSLALVVGAVISAGAILLLLRRRTRWALALLAAGLVAVGAGYVLATGAPQEAAAEAPQEKEIEIKTEMVSEIEPIVLGEILFVAKGCATCHLNNKIDRSLVSFTTEVGPNLSSYQASAELLRLWLTDPKTAKPQTKMPDLELSAAEIEALIVFLNAESKK
jgi:cytochrome c2